MGDNMSWLLTCPCTDGNFKNHLSYATAAEVSEAIEKVRNMPNNCGDTCKETYLKEKEALKKKWFENSGVRVRRIVDESLDDLRRELYETYGIKAGDTNG